MYTQKIQSGISRLSKVFFSSIMKEQSFTRCRILALLGLLFKSRPFAVTASLASIQFCVVESIKPDGNSYVDVGI